MDKQDYRLNLSHLRERITFPFSALLDREIPLDEFYMHFFQSPSQQILDGLGIEIVQDAPTPDLISGQRWVITGPMGSGKSTLLARWFLDVKRSCSEIPVLVSMQEIMSDAEVRKKALNGAVRTVFIDSLDETALEHDSEALQTVIRQILKQPSVVLACRSPFFYDRFNPSNRKSLSGIVALVPLNPTAQAELAIRYVKAISTLEGENWRTGIDKEVADLLKRCRAHANMESTLVATPMFTALCVFISAHGATETHGLEGVTSVYAAFVSDLAARKFGNKDALEKLGHLAFILESRRTRKEVILSREIEAMFGHQFMQQVMDMVLMRKNLLGEGEILVDFRHHSIAEFLVARHVVTTLLDGRNGIEQASEVLSTLFNYETSFFIRRLSQDIPAEQRKKVCQIMRELVTSRLHSGNERDVLIVNNSIYLLAHVDSEGAEWLEDLVESINGKIDRVHALVAGTLLSALTTTKRFNSYHRVLLTTDVDGDLITRNLNYHLFYYGDSDYRNPDDFERPISAHQEWENSRHVLIQRLRATDQKRLLFKGFDLSSFRELWTRTEYRMTPEEISDLRSILSSASTWITLIADDRLQTVVLEEVAKLQSMIQSEKYSSITEDTMKTTEHSMESPPILEHIAQGESHTLEFKETLEYDIRKSEKTPSLAKSSLKTVAAFLNADGGTLLIGVSDAGEVKGIARDLQFVKGNNSDGFEQKLRSLINDHFDPSPLGNVEIRFEDLQEGTVCQINVKSSSEPIAYDKDFHVRDGNGTRKLEGRDLADWLRRRNNG